MHKIHTYRYIHQTLTIRHGENPYKHSVANVRIGERKNYMNNNGGEKFSVEIVCTLFTFRLNTTNINKSISFHIYNSVTSSATLTVTFSFWKSDCSFLKLAKNGISLENKGKLSNSWSKIRITSSQAPLQWTFKICEKYCERGREGEKNTKTYLINNSQISLIYSSQSSLILLLGIMIRWVYVPIPLYSVLTWSYNFLVL